MSEVGWFACYEDERGTAFPWTPALQCEGSLCPNFDVWFESKEACEDFIRTEILGKPLLAGPRVIAGTVAP